MKEKIFPWIDGAVSLAVELQGELTKRPAVSPDSGGIPAQDGQAGKCTRARGLEAREGCFLKIT